jgi:hypothetical protein
MLPQPEETRDEKRKVYQKPAIVKIAIIPNESVLSTCRNDFQICNPDGAS